MRHLILLVAVLLVLAGCGGGDEPEPEEESPTTEAAATETTEDEAALATEALESLCAQYCAPLQAAFETDCPEPRSDATMCVDYLTDLVIMGGDVQRGLQALPFAARDYPQILEATTSLTEASETFAEFRCFEVVAPRLEAAACSARAVSIRYAAATVGITLETEARPR